MKRILFLSLILIPCLLTLSCKEKENGENTTGNPAQLSVVVKDALPVYEVPEHQNVALSLMVTADPTSAEAYTITIAANPGLVSSYNSKNGTSYLMLPSSAYAFSSNSVVLPRYSAKSSPCELRLIGEGCDADQVYLLPVTIDGVQGGNNFQAPDDKAAYILFKMLASEQEGDGTEAHPYDVCDVESFMAIGSMLKDEATTFFKMSADIDFADVVFTDEKPWVPINNATTDETQTLARARRIVLEGNNHKISNFKAGGPLFGVLCGSVQNLTIENAVIDCDADDGAVLVGVAGSSDNADDFIAKNITITGSKVDNSTDIVTGKRAGGLTAYLRNGLVENCSVECSIETGQQGGSLIGRLGAGTVKNCSGAGDVSVDSYHGGGLIGYVGEATITGCHASGNVTQITGGNSRIGGLIGSLCGASTVEKSYSTGNMDGAGHWGGGLIGCIYDTVGGTINVSECYATGSVTMPHGESGNQAHAGGLIGTVSPKSDATVNTVVNITNCYSTGAVVTRRYSSGFLGSIYAANAEVHILNGFTTSDISGIRVQERCGLVFGHGGSYLMDGKSTITCKGFVGWNTGDWRFSWGWEKDGAFYDAFPVDGNYNGHEGTVSQQAKALNWDETIWDLTGELPKLKNVQ